MSAKSDPRPAAAPNSYYFRRSLSARELLPALGVGLAAGALAFYITAVVMQRTPLGARGGARRKLLRRARAD